MITIVVDIGRRALVRDGQQRVARNRARSLVAVMRAFTSDRIATARELARARRPVKYNRQISGEGARAIPYNPDSAK